VSLAIFLGMALGALGILGWLGYQVNEWLRPYTPMEVCQKLQEAKTPLEAKNYTTPRMQTWIEQVYKEQTPEDPNDQFEFTRETEGPQLGIKMVGFRGSTWFPEVGQRKKMEGYFRLILSSGWKIDDMVFTGVEGMALEKPVSIVELFQGEAARNAASKFKSTNQGTLPPAPRRGLLGAYDSIQNQLGWGRFFVLLLVAGGILGLWEKIKK
jgi:hypothetical protein